MYSVIEFYIFTIFSGIQFCITNRPTSFNWIIKNLNEKKKKINHKINFYIFFLLFHFYMILFIDLILSLSIYNAHNIIHHFIIDTYQFSISNINFKKHIGCFIIYYWWTNIHQLIFELIYRIVNYTFFLQFYIK